MTDGDLGEPAATFPRRPMRRTRTEVLLRGPMPYRPGGTWRVPEYALPPGVKALPVGEVIGVTDRAGRRGEFLVDAAARDHDARVYQMVLLGEEVDVRNAQMALVALVEHVSATGCEFVLTVHGTATAKLSPLEVEGPAAGPTR
jgi:hypothetical protein